MKREERALEYARTVPIPFAPDDVTKVILDAIRDAYLAGAKDAEENPAWRMCEDELPEEDELVLCLMKSNGAVVSGYISTSRHGFPEVSTDAGFHFEDDGRYEAVAWLPIPQFNPKQETE